MLDINNTMAKKLLEVNFPTIDSAVSEYINGVFKNADDFEDSDDFFNTIGVMLLEQNKNSHSEENVRDLCDKMFHLLRVDQSCGNSSLRPLSTPVNLYNLSKDIEEERLKNLWTGKFEKDSAVDQKKLGKAEAKIKQKFDKRAGLSTEKKEVVQEVASANQQANRRLNKLDASGANKCYDIIIDNFDISYGSKVLLEGADMQLNAGRRYGLVGRNGIGKTTLLRMIALGQLQIPSHLSVLHVEQEVIGDDTLAVQSVLECWELRENLIKEEQALSQEINLLGEEQKDNQLSERLVKVYQDLQAIEADKAPSNASQILFGLGFSAKMQQMPTKEFSGGWRMRLALARALFSKPDLLLLDEPTNMLDLKAIVWLENYLQAWTKSILLVSHDRNFLNSVSTDILFLYNKKLDLYRGNYETFIRAKEEKLKNQQREYEAQKQRRDEVQVFIDRFRYNANRAAQVQSKIKMLQKMPDLQPLAKEGEVVLRFHEIEKLASPIVRLDEVEFRYAATEPILFKNVDLSVSYDSRICIVGENGAGKTTLLKILLGELEPTKGFRHCHRNLKIGYFSQHHVDQLDMSLTCIEILAAKFPGLPSERYRQQLGSFGISGDLALRSVISLSGGQKSRLAFSQMCMAAPNFLILDEPTNHLDMETIEALGRAINLYGGGVVLVSHDDRLIRLVCRECWLCRGGSVECLEGGIDQYKRVIMKELEEAS